MRKRIILVILLSSLIDIHPVNASNEIALKSKRFTPAKGIIAAAKARIEAIPGRARNGNPFFEIYRCVILF